MGLWRLHLRSARRHRLACSERRPDRPRRTGGIRIGAAGRFLVAPPPPLAKDALTSLSGRRRRSHAGNARAIETGTGGLPEMALPGAEDWPVSMHERPD